MNKSLITKENQHEWDSSLNPADKYRMELRETLFFEQYMYGETELYKLLLSEWMRVCTNE